MGIGLFCVSFFFAQTSPLEMVAQWGPLCHSSAGEGVVSFVLFPNKMDTWPLRQVSVLVSSLGYTIK